MKLAFLLLIPFLSFSQIDSYELLKKLPKDKLHIAVNDSIIILRSLDLWNFLKVVQEEKIVNLKDYNKQLIQKIEVVKWPIDMHFLSKILLEQNTDKTLLERILNERKEIWDKGEWSQKMWKLIRENNLNVFADSYYVIDQNGEKTYDIKTYLAEKTKAGELGSNPLLEINYSLADYSQGELMKTLNRLNIKDLEIIPKSKSAGLFGKRGIDGMLKVLTK